MSIVVAGISHHTAPVEIREKLAACSSEVFLSQDESKTIKESLFISTCNRVEIIVVIDEDTPVDDITDKMIGSIGQFEGDEYESIRNCLYIKQDNEAVRHVFRVASSLDSMVVGEPQILGQIKEAYRQASKEGSLGVVLNRLMHKTFSVAKKVRTETGISDHAVSISYAAVELARKIFGDLDGKTALLIGAGEMAELAAENLLANGVDDLIVANRTLKRAMEVAVKFNGRAASLDELRNCLIEADIVISSTAATEPVLTYDLVKSTIKPRKRKPMFIIDIAVPRDVEEKAGKVENVYLYDIDELQSVVAKNVESRRQEAVKAERIVEEEAIKFDDWLISLSVVPTIKMIQTKLDIIRQKELSKTLSSNHFSEEQIEALDSMTRAMMKKVLHHPATWLKRNFRNPDNAERYLDAAHRFFGLDKTTDEDD